MWLKLISPGLSRDCDYFFSVLSESQFLASKIYITNFNLVWCPSRCILRVLFSISLVLVVSLARLERISFRTRHIF